MRYHRKTRQIALTRITRVSVCCGKVRTISNGDQRDRRVLQTIANEQNVRRVLTSRSQQVSKPRRHHDLRWKNDTSSNHYARVMAGLFIQCRNHGNVPVYDSSAMTCKFTARSIQWNKPEPTISIPHRYSTTLPFTSSPLIVQFAVMARSFGSRISTSLNTSTHFVMENPSFLKRLMLGVLVAAIRATR